MALDFIRRTDRARERYGDRVPPHQKETEGWSILTYGSTPRADLTEWKFIVAGAVEEKLTFTWEEFNALPQTTVGCDIHCVTGWSKLDNESQPGFWEQYGYHIRGHPWAEERYS